MGRESYIAITRADPILLSSTVPNNPKEVKMLALWTKLSKFVREEKGASMVEYALLVVLIAIIAIVAISIAGRQVSTAFSTIANTLSN
jgi:pilus assembly protein Flp/PilA